MLGENGRFFQDLFENEHLIMLLIDPLGGKIVEANRGASLFYGWTAEQFKNKVIWDINTLSENEVKEEMRLAASKNKRVFHFSHRTASGEIRAVEVISGPIVIDGKNLLYSHVQDITDRKIAEKKQLRNSEFESTMLDLAQNFINMPLEHLDQAVNAAILRVVEYCGARRAALWKYEWSQNVSVKLYEYDKEPQAGLQYDRVPIDHFSNTLEAFKRGEESFLSCDENADDMQRQYFMDSGIWSTLVVPLLIDGRLTGTFTISIKDGKNKLGSVEKNTVRIFAQMLTSVLQRKESALALCESCENYQLILNSTNDGIALFDRKGNVLSANKTIAARYSFFKEIIGRNLEELLPVERYGDLYKRRLQKFQQAFDSKIPVVFEDSRDGFWFYNRVYPVFKEGEVKAVALFTADITDRKKAEQETLKNAELKQEAKMLRKKEQDYFEILDGSTIGSWIYDIQKRTMEYSPQWKKHIGGENIPSTDLFRYAQTLLHPDDQASVLEVINTAVLSARTNNVKNQLEYRVLTVDQGYLWILAQWKVIYNKNKTPAKIYGTLMDVTDRKNAEEALRQSESLLRAILEGTTDPIFLKDRQSRMLLVNKAAAEVCGLQASCMIGKTVLEFIKDQEKAQIMIGNDKRIMDAGAAEVLEKIIPLPGGDRTYLASKVPWHDLNGNVIGLIGVARDITDRKIIEKQLQRTTAELIQKNKLITEFFTNISHEFKTPLTIILLQLELMKLYAGDMAKINKFIDVAAQNSNRLTRLVENLLDITKIDAGFSHLNISKTDIVSLLKEICDSVQVYAKAKSIKLTYQTTLLEKIMPTDPDKIERILLNLLSNAIKHTNKNGEIIVGVEDRNEDGIVISVEDNGEGIPKDMQMKIFDRFAQVDTALNRATEGTGIGLSLVKSLVVILGGAIFVTSELGKGSTFTITLPLIESPSGLDMHVKQGFNLAKMTEIELSDLYLKPSNNSI